MLNIRLIAALMIYFFSFLPVHASTDEIVIGAGDSISIDVYNERDLSVKAKVGQTGWVRIPLIGNVQVIGKTSSALGQEIEQLLFDGFLVDPQVTVTIVSFRPVYVKGAVNRPGKYEFTPGMTLEQAIAVAGGLKDRASNDNWLILRAKNDAMRAGKQSELKPGDIVQIEESIF